MIVQLRSRKNGYALIDTDTGDEVTISDLNDISSLTVLVAGSIDANNDILPIFDVSATTTKKVTAADVIVAGLSVAQTIAGNMSFTGTANAFSGSLTIGGGTAVAKILSATAILNFGSIAAGSFEDLTITVTGAADGDAAICNPPNGSLVDNVFYDC